MSSCKELPLDDMAAITAIPIENYSDDTYSYILSPTIVPADFNPIIDENTIVIGGVRTSDGALISIVHSTGSVKDSESNSVAGRLHTVSVECEVDDRDADTWALLQTLYWLVLRHVRRWLITARIAC